jgi:hypothetical protein
VTARVKHLQRHLSHNDLVTVLDMDICRRRGRKPPLSGHGLPSLGVEKLIIQLVNHDFRASQTLQSVVTTGVVAMTVGVHDVLELVSFVLNRFKDPLFVTPWVDD